MRKKVYKRTAVNFHERERGGERYKGGRKKDGKEIIVQKKPNKKGKPAAAQ